MLDLHLRSRLQPHHRRVPIAFALDQNKSQPKPLGALPFLCKLQRGCSRPTTSPTCVAAERCKFREKQPKNSRCQCKAPLPTAHHPRLFIASLALGARFRRLTGLPDDVGCKEAVMACYLQANSCWTDSGCQPAQE